MKKIILPLSIVLFASLFFASLSFSQWTKMTSLPANQVYDIFISGNTLYSASHSNGIYRSTDGTASWQQVSSGLNNPQAIQCTQVTLVGNILYASTVDGIYRSTNSGALWEKKSTGIVVGNGAIYEFCESVFELNGTLFTGAFTGLYRSTDGAETWLPTNVTGQHIWAKNFTVHNGIIFAARETNNSPIGFKSTDNGLTWGNVTGLSFYNTISFYSEPGKLFAGTIHGAWLSTDNGTTWSHRINGLSADPYNSAFIRANGILVTSLEFGGSGMFKSTDDGLLWQDFSEGLGFLTNIKELLLFNNKILAATSGGIYERNISELTSVSQVSSEIPAEFSLSQNYPNPFNPATKIRFDIPSASNVMLIVYDMTGKIIAEPVNNQLKPGTYEFTFDASYLSTGIYFYRLVTNEFKSVKKMTLIK